MSCVEEIARACPGRIEAMVFGVADYAASMQSHTTKIGGVDPAYSVLTDESEGRRELHWGDSGTTPLADGGRLPRQRPAPD